MLLYPFLVATYPGAALLAANAHTVGVQETTRVLALALLLTALLLIIYRLMFRGWDRAGLLTSVTMLLFFSYGHVYNVVAGVQLAGLNVGRHRYLLAGWLVLLLLSAYVFGRRMKKPERLRSALNLTSVALLILPIYTVVTSEFGSNNLGVQSEAPTPAPTSTPAGAVVEAEGKLPDIYYIILDGYAREDILLDRYGYDNSEFVEFLETRGFYVADQSQANYLYSALSIGTSLNLDYVQDLDVNLETATYPEFLFEPIHHSLVRRKLADYGYELVTVPTGYEATDIEDAEYRLTPDMDTMEVLVQGGVLNRFESLILSTSALRVAVDLQTAQDDNWFARQLKYPYHVHRLNVLSAFNNLTTIPYISGPNFVFVHIISPHRPYIFGPNGEELKPEGVFTFRELDTLPGGERANAYLGQLTYITSRTQDVIDAILQRSAEPPIIIIQSDHGPGFGMDWENPDAEILENRAAILNAYYMPEECRSRLYPSISPVNSFRILFQCVFQEPYPLVEDISYFSNIRYSSLAEPWEFTPISEFGAQSSQDSMEE